MAHAQKPDLVFQQNGRVHLNRRGGGISSVDYWQSGSADQRIDHGYTMFRGSVKGTGYPLHSHLSPSLPLPCVTVCHHVPNGLYQVYGGVCHAEGFGLLLVKCCDPILMCVIPVVLVQQYGAWCINTYSRTQLYLLLVLQEDYNSDMFRHYTWAIFRL